MPEPNTSATESPADKAAILPEPSAPDTKPQEIGGRGGLDPTRYGDWEKDGRCIDF